MKRTKKQLSQSDKNEKNKCGIDKFLASVNSDIAKIKKIVGSEALAKACMDPYDYALRIRTGEIIFFQDATIVDKGWVHLNLHNYHDQEKNPNKLQLPGGRGIDIRISDIVWVMDAPYGS